MSLVKWFIRVVFLWIPIVFLVGYMLFCGLVLPFFFGEGTADFWKFVEKDNAGLLVVQLAILLAVNAMYERLWNLARRFRIYVVDMLIGAIDAVYDKLLGGQFGRGESSVAVLVAAGVYCVCICFGGFMLIYICCFLYFGLGEMDVSWSAWMKWKYAGRISYRWMPLTLALVFLTQPLLHVIDRPVRELLEKAMGCFKKKGNTNIVSVQEDAEDE